MDLTGTLALTGFGILLAFNQVVMKVTGEGFSPVFQAGLRSAGATVLVAGWILLQGRDLRVSPHVVPSGLLLGALFGLEFLFLFNGIDLTTVSRASIMLYSMPVWLALAAHFVLPGERLTPPRAAGLVMAMAGVVLALFDPATGQEGNLIGDLLALAAALCWAGIALCVRLTPVAQARPEMQLMFQLSVSAVMLLALAPLFGDLIRDPGAIHYAGLTYQIVVIAAFGFLLWLHLMAVYKASAVSSFAFLSPIFSVLMGWLILGETLGPRIWIALVLVAAGLVLINRR